MKWFAASHKDASIRLLSKHKTYNIQTIIICKLKIGMCNHFDTKGNLTLEGRR
jgi:hypothetical protein